jgi:hypothetical protein
MAEKRERLAEDFVALRCTAYITHNIKQIRLLLQFAAFGFVFVVLSANAYPFQSQHIIRWFLTLMFVILSWGVVRLFMQMDRDAVLSQLHHTTPGKLDLGFYAHLSSVGLVPLLAILASHFPIVGRFLFSWVEPAVKALH